MAISLAGLLALVTPQNLILAGVGVNVAANVGRAVFHTPKQRAQIDAIEAKTDLVLNQVGQAIPTVQKAAQDAKRAAANTADLSLALKPLPSSETSSAQGGAS